LSPTGLHDFETSFVDGFGDQRARGNVEGFLGWQEGDFMLCQFAS
jgi:hypothetical protein